MDEDSFEMELNKYITLDGQLAPDIIGGIQSPSLHLQLESATKVGQLLRSQKRAADATVQAVVDSGLLSNVINMLSSSDAALVSEASWILLNATRGTTQQRLTAVNAGAISRLVQVVASASDVGDLRRNALLALGNIAGDSPLLRDIFLNRRGFRPALDILADPSKSSPETVNTAAWVMETCSAPGKISTFSEAIPILCKVILMENESKPLAAVVKALRRICSSPKAANMIFEAGSCPLLIQLCTSENDDLREDALYLVSRIAKEGGSLVQLILDNGILQALQTCITEHVKTRKEACAVASTIAWATPSGAKLLVKSSVLPLLVAMVADQEEKAEVQREAFTALQHLAARGENQHSLLKALVKADCVEACCAALRSQDELRVYTAVCIVQYLIDTPWSGADDAIERLEDSDGITQKIIDGICSEDRSVRLEAATKLRRLLTKNREDTIQSIIRCGLLSALVGMLSADDLQLLRCSASILLEVTVGSSEEISAVAEEGAIPKLVSLFSRDSDEAKDLALSLLGNISADSLPLRDAVIEAGGFALFLDVLENPDNYTGAIVDAAAQALAFCTRHNAGGPSDEDLTHQMITALATFIGSTENAPSQSLEDALMTLGRIVQDRPTTIAAVDTGITDQLVQLTSSTSRRVQYHALECLAAFTFHGLDGIDALIDAEGLESLGIAMTSPHFEHRSVACRAVDCIVSSIPAHVESLIPSPVVPALARVVSNEDEYAELRYQATLALSTLSGKASGDAELNFIIKAGSTEAFCSILQPSDYNDSLLALQAIIALVSQDWEGQKEAVERLKTAGGVSRLRDLRDGVAVRDQAIRNMAQIILKAHFPESSQHARV